MHRRQAGSSLIECAIVSTVVALTLGAALPSFQEARQRRHLEGTAAQLETDLQLARAEAVARNEPVRLSFAQGDAGSCYWLHTGAKPTAACEHRAEALRQVQLDAAVRLQSNSASLLFDPIKGTVTPTATVRLQTEAGTLHLVVNVMGRVRSCSPDGALPGLARC